MAQVIYWILATATMVLLLTNAVFMLIRTIKDNRRIKRIDSFWKNLNSKDIKVGDRVRVNKLLKGYGTVTEISYDMYYVEFDKDLPYCNCFYRKEDLIKEDK